MANPHRFYLSHMHNKTGYRASWDPGHTLKIGFVGKLDKAGVFIVYTSLQREGITPDVLSDVSEGQFDYSSHDQVDIAVKAAGTAPALGSALTEADAGFSVEFKSNRGIVFQADGFKTHQIVNISEVERQVLEKYKNGNWDKDWLIITKLVEASAATILISNSNNSKLELKAKAGVGTGKLKLTDANLGLTVAREQGSTLKYISEKGLTPLYSLMGVRHPWLGSPSVVTKATVGQEATEDDFKVQDFLPEELEEIEENTPVAQP